MDDNNSNLVAATSINTTKHIAGSSLMHGQNKFTTDG